MSLNAGVDDQQSEIKQPQFPQSTALPVQSTALTIIAVLGMVLVLGGNVMVLRGKQAATRHEASAPAERGVEKSARA